MDYKEKYEEAVERARTIYNGSYKPDKALVIAEVLPHIFPELKESEDEKTRKGIMALVEQSTEILSGSNKKRMLAWLEKQGEQKSADNADMDTNWKEGDVIRYSGVLAFVISGRRTINYNLKESVIQYPNEWVKASAEERKLFFDKLAENLADSDCKAATTEEMSHKPIDKAGLDYNEIKEYL